MYIPVNDGGVGEGCKLAPAERPSSLNGFIERPVRGRTPDGGNPIALGSRNPELGVREAPSAGRGHGVSCRNGRWASGRGCHWNRRGDARCPAGTRLPAKESVLPGRGQRATESAAPPRPQRGRSSATGHPLAVTGGPLPSRRPLQPHPRPPRCSAWGPFLPRGPPSSANGGVKDQTFLLLCLLSKRVAAPDDSPATSAPKARGSRTQCRE